MTCRSPFMYMVVLLPLGFVDPPAAEAETPLRWAPPQTASTHDGNDLKVELLPPAFPVYKAGDVVDINALLTATNGHWQLSDPFLCDGRNTRLLVFCGRSLQCVLQPNDLPTTSGSMLLSGVKQMATGRVFRLATGSNPTPLLSDQELVSSTEFALGPGEYEIQLLVGFSVLPENQRDVPALKESRQLLHGGGVFLRSNTIRLTIQPDALTPLYETQIPLYEHRQQSPQEQMTAPLAVSIEFSGESSEISRARLLMRNPAAPRLMRAIDRCSIRRIVRNCSTETQRILDPFVESGLIRSGDLRLQDERGKVLVDLLYSSTGNIVHILQVKMPPDSLLGHTVDFKLQTIGGSSYHRANST